MPFGNNAMFFYGGCNIAPGLCNAKKAGFGFL
jgi:hypothetical protein